MTRVLFHPTASMRQVNLEQQACRQTRGSMHRKTWTGMDVAVNHCCARITTTIRGTATQASRTGRRVRGPLLIVAPSLAVTCMA
jgi:hypothetical protein